jgi:hypothetical protein
MITFHAIFARKHGEANAYPVIAAFGDEGLTAVLEKYGELTGSDGEDFRSATAEMTMIRIEGDHFVREAHHIFPDPTQIEKERKARDLAEAKRIRAENDAADLALENAKDRVQEAKDSLQKLSPEQKELLDEADEAAEKALAAHEKEEQRRADEEAASELEQERLAKEGEKQSAAAAASVESGTSLLTGAVAGSGPADDLDDKTIDELKSLGDEEDVDLTGAKLKQDYIDRIRAYRTLDGANKVDDLKTLAQTESVDLTGLTLKAEFINAILNARRLKAAPLAENLTPVPQGQT